MSNQQNMAMMLQALKNAGLNDNQARILGAEIGRENAFQGKYLWGYHSDPQNKAVNIGIISWQGSRGRGVEAALKNAGLIKDGKIVKGQESLDVMAKYLVNEIKTDPNYAATKKQFLDNPDVDYQTGARVLGTNFIRWRYNDPKYASGHKNRDEFYAKLGGVAPTSGDADMGLQVADGLTPVQTAPTTSTVDSLFGNTPATLLQGSTGLVLPDTRKENELFSGIADMGLDGQTEAVYAEMAKGIAGASDSIASKPMIQSTNPLRAELSSLFDKINV